MDHRRAGPDLCVKTGLSDDAYSQVSCTSFTINNRWRVSSANSPPPEERGSSASAPHVPYVSRESLSPSPTAVEPPALPRHPSSIRSKQDAASSTAVGVPQTALTSRGVPRKVESHGGPSSRIRGNSAYRDFFRNFDWASTDVGPMESWSQQLIEVCNLVLACPNPMGVYWGEDPILLYNEGVIATIGDRHPDALGAYIRNMFSEMWDGSFKQLYENIVEQGQAWMQHNDRRIGYRDGRLEEVFWNLTFVPIFKDNGGVAGTWVTFYDVTASNFWQRRISTLLRLTASMNASKSFDAMWDSFIGGFADEDGNRDVPYLLVYTTPERPSATSSTAQSTKYRLRATLAYDSSRAPYTEVDVTAHDHALAQLFRQTLDADTPTFFDKAHADLSAEFWSAFQSADSSAEITGIVMIPVRPTQAKDVMAYVVIGLHSFVRYDQNYREFIDLAQRQVSSTMASILLREEEVRRERLVAEEASDQLGVWKAEAKAHELRFTRLAETAPIGICTYSVDGSLTYANDVYCGIFGISKDASGSDWWNHLVHSEDLDMARERFGRLLIQRQAVTFEIRVKCQPGYKATPTAEGYLWLLVSAYAEPFGDGPQTVVACFTDINEQKRAEDIQSRRLQDMINAKRQQEAFIDMTSHEIRNPLSVVLQCSEEIIATCSTSHNDIHERKVDATARDLDNILDAAETIEFCTLHQKRIVDDILTLSKLESDLLPVTPDRVRPIVLVEGVMKIFEREIRKSEMQMTISVHPTFHEHHLERVLLDPSRVSQIMINLVSNAIKFTKTQSDRRLDIWLGASQDGRPPAETWPVKTYMPRHHKSQQAIFGESWTDGEAVQLHFAVVDTGAGMSPEEQQKIFSRFTQASPRTQVKYGGSGLGLYICRALSETHGGQIGCASAPGKGSAFGFHVKVGRVPQQQRPLPGSQHNSTTDTKTSTSSPANSIKTKVKSHSKRAPPVTSPTDKSGSPSRSASHVLIVEDNVLNQKVLRRQLERAGNTVSVAHHGQDAIDQLRRTKSWVGSTDNERIFDFILMDVEMPIMDGLVCTQQIRKYESSGVMVGHVPIIATTGNARDEKIQSALAAGMDQVVLKPYSLSVLLPIADQLRQQYGAH